MSDTIDRSGCTAQEHGNVRAYRNGCRCDDAKASRSRYRKRLRCGLAEPAHIDVTGSRRRIQALYAMGWPCAEIAQRIGVYSASSVSRIVHHCRWIHRDLAMKIKDLYEELGDTQGPSRSTMIRARSKGLRPPMYWEGLDIDDPNVELPDEVSETTSLRDTVDRVVVEGAVDAVTQRNPDLVPARKLTRAERHAVVTELYRRGISVSDTSEVLGIDSRVLARDRKVLGLALPVKVHIRHQRTRAEIAVMSMTLQQWRTTRESKDPIEVNGAEYQVEHGWYEQVGRELVGILDVA